MSPRKPGRGPRRLSLIFDLDGTLIDSAADIAAAANAVLQEAGAPPLPAGRVLNMVGGGAPKLLERAFGAANVPIEDPEALLDRFLVHYHTGRVNRTLPYPGVTGLLRRLRRAGHPMAVCTNKPRRATDAILNRLGWSNLFNVVVAGDDLPVKKPHPAPVHAILQLLQARADRTLFVGDSGVDVKAARAAGVSVAVLAHGYAHRPVSVLGADYLLKNVRPLNALVGT